jgi:hypothetical protein
MIKCDLCGTSFGGKRALNCHITKIHREHVQETRNTGAINNYDSNFAAPEDVQHGDAMDIDPTDHNNLQDDPFDNVPVAENIGNPSDRYLRMQYEFCKEVYGAKAFYASGRQSFVECVKEDKLEANEKDYACFLAYQCLHLQCGLTRNDADKILKLFHTLIDIVKPSEGSSPSSYLQQLHDSIPSGWRQVTNRFRAGSVPKPSTVPYPARWFMDYWDQSNGPKPKEVSLIPLDPIERIAMQWLNPEIAICKEKEIKFAYTPDIVTGIACPLLLFNFRRLLTLFFRYW